MEPFVPRVTMTRPVLGAARDDGLPRHRRGEGRRGQARLREPPSPETPASLVRGVRTIAILDRAAASLALRATWGRTPTCLDRRLLVAQSARRHSASVELRSRSRLLAALPQRRSTPASAHGRSSDVELGRHLAPRRQRLQHEHRVRDRHVLEVRRRASRTTRAPTRPPRRSRPRPRRRSSRARRRRRAGSRRGSGSRPRGPARARQSPRTEQASAAA